MMILIIYYINYNKVKIKINKIYKIFLENKILKYG